MDFKFIILNMNEVFYNFFNSIFSNIVKLVSLNEVSLDASERWQLGFQDPASPIMEGIEHLHNDIMFFIVVLAVLVSYILWRTLKLFSTNGSDQSDELSSRILHLENYKNGVYHHTFLEIV
jgi:heme/copper-type cytochrome/quinol oxidase subunit 2